ncbi:MAG: riboflavin synthase [Candidatus Micrarchaeota archaeon]
MNKIRIGVVDTTFARMDMFKVVKEELMKYPEVEITRKTVPGMKDTPIACKKLLDEGCSIAIALVMVGKEKIDEQCGHEAALGIQTAQLMANKHIIGVFIHETEALDNEGNVIEKDLKEIALNRARKHALNAYLLIAKPEELEKNAGKGLRQGKNDVGAIGD